MKIVRKQYKNFFVNYLELEEEDYQKININKNKNNVFSKTEKGRILEFSILKTCLRFGFKCFWYGKKIGHGPDAIIEMKNCSILVECKNWNDKTRLSKNKVDNLVLKRFKGFEDDNKKNVFVLVYSGGKVGKKVKEYLDEKGIILIEVNEKQNIGIIWKFKEFLDDILKELVERVIKLCQRKPRPAVIRMWIARQKLLWEEPPPDPLLYGYW